ncbi:hypothetical protein Tco_0549182 [Tanacetum coccineum]
MNQQREQEALLAAQRERELLAQKQAAQEKEELPQNSDFRMSMNTMLLSINLKSQHLVQERHKVKNITEPAAKRRTCITSCLQNFKVITKERIIPLNNTPQISPVNAITYNLPTEAPEYSLSMGDKHLDTIPEIELDVENLVPIPSESEVTSVNEREIRLVKNLRFDNSSPPTPEVLNAEIDYTILESLSTSPIPIEDSDSHMEEIDLFLATDDSMPPGIKNNDYDSEGDIRFLEELLSNDSPPFPENESSNLDHFNDPSSPRPPPEPPDVEIFFDFKPDTGVLTTKIFDPGIFIEVQTERLLSRDEFSISFIHDPLSPVFDTLLPFSSKNEDKVFKPGILSYLLVSHQDKINSDFCVPVDDVGRDILFFGRFPLSPFLSPLTKLKYGGSSQAQDSVNKNKRFDYPDFEDFRARCFVHRSLALQILSMLILGI